MDFVEGGGAGSGGVLVAGSVAENGPILYTEPNRTSAIEDIRNVVIYIFIITVLVSFILILPGIRTEKFPTFLCITTSLIVTSIIIVSLFGTTWHVGQLTISGPYKSFSRDKIQGDLSVNMGLQSVNITLRAHKYYIMHATHGPMLMENSAGEQSFSSAQQQQTQKAQKTHSSSKPQLQQPQQPTSSKQPEEARNLAEELISDRTADGATVDTELEVEEVFGSESAAAAAADSTQNPRKPQRKTRSSSRDEPALDQKSSSSAKQRNTSQAAASANARVNVDINYNERFYMIGPNQMGQEYHQALERGLPNPILTVLEYLSQDAAGFNWTRQYRLAGYYSTIMLWLSFSCSVLMFVLHCAAPKHGIYTMQLLGVLLLFTNLTYAILVPRGDGELKIPFEGKTLERHQLIFKFGLNFWIVFFGGCLSLVVGTLIVIIDILFPNFIFTTILDVDFDSRNNYYKHRVKRKTQENFVERPVKPPFLEHSGSLAESTSESSTPALSSPNASQRVQPSERERANQSEELGERLNNSDGLQRRPAASQRGDSETLSVEQLAKAAAAASPDSNARSSFESKATSEKHKHHQRAAAKARLSQPQAGAKATKSGHINLDSGQPTDAARHQVRL